MRLLITGATGFLGGAVLADILAKHSDIELTLAVRAADVMGAKQRLLHRLARFDMSSAWNERQDRFRVLPLGLEALNCIDPALLQDTTHVLHLAADTSFSSQTSPWDVNFDGSIGLAKLAARLPRLQRFVHVGTATICGERPHRLVVEDDYPIPGMSHLVEYTKSKAATEIILRERFRDLPIVVARPSIVVGHTKLGIRPSSSIFWFVRFAEALGLVPGSTEVTIDIVPVDWVASGLVHLLRAPSLSHETYHLSAGRGSAVSWGSMLDAFAGQGQRRISRHIQEFEPDSFASVQLIKQRAKEIFNYSERTARLLSRAAQRYYKFCNLDVTFDNSRILAEGLGPPPSLVEYLPTCLTSAKGRSVLEQFADDIEMFDGVIEGSEIASATSAVYGT